jgi:hypothetical protein
MASVLVVPPARALSLAGVCSFVDDPGLSAAQVTPVWSALFDPSVLKVHAGALKGSGPTLDLARDDIAIRAGPAARHIVINDGSGLRLDVVSGTVRAGSTSLSPLVDLGRDLEPQLRSVRQLHAAMQGSPARARPDHVFLRLVDALRVTDARAAGVSLRDIGLHVLAGAEWPGDGEHLKSRVRRLIEMGDRLRAAGPASLFTHGRPSARP